MGKGNIIDHEVFPLSSGVTGVRRKRNQNGATYFLILWVKGDPFKIYPVKVAKMQREGGEREKKEKEKELKCAELTHIFILITSKSVPFTTYSTYL